MQRKQPSGKGARRRRSAAGEGHSHNRYTHPANPEAEIAGVREGLPLSDLADLANLLQVDRSRLAALLDTSIRTVQRKAGADARLAPAASDRLARIRRIVALATHVLGEPEAATRWIRTPSERLGGEAPLQWLDTDAGTQLVQQELRQIEFGMPV